MRSEFQLPMYTIVSLPALVFHYFASQAVLMVRSWRHRVCFAGDSRVVVVGMVKGSDDRGKGMSIVENMCNVSLSGDVSLVGREFAFEGGSSA